jgi:hypothetical protein
LVGHSCLLSSGAPNSPVHHQTTTVHVRCAISFHIRRNRPLLLGAIGAPDTVWCIQPTVGASHVSCADCAGDRCRWRRWLTGQSGAPPDSPVNFSHTPLSFSREQPVHRRPAWRTEHCPVHHRTVRCARPELMLAAHSQSFSKFVSLFSALFLALGQIC